MRTELAHGIAPTQPCLGEIREQGYCPVEALKRLVEPTLLEQIKSVVNIARWEIWIDREGLTKEFVGLLNLAGFRADDSQQMKCIKVSWIADDDLSVETIQPPKSSRCDAPPPPD